MNLVVTCADNDFDVRYRVTKVAGALFVDSHIHRSGCLECILNVQIDIAGRVVERVSSLIWNLKSEAAHVGL
jgi:hypothetical protein